jgi:DNA polymerase III, epsilon subunit and related 3''-5'' exonucleases
MENFAAIDFEIANHDVGSICSIGIVVVKDGRIAEKIYELVKPEPDYYHWFMTRIHGLTQNDTEDAPVFSSVWNKIAPQLEGLPLVAHNSGFDEACLKAAHKTYRMDYPDYPFYCTVKQARKRFPFLPNHKLPTVAAYIGYNLDNHHHALADAEACALIALEVF